MDHVAGVYRITKRAGDALSPIVYFDGTKWWLPGWECSMDLGDDNGSFTIDRKIIGELVWRDDAPRTP